MTTTLPTEPTPVPAADVQPLDRSATIWRIGLWSVFAVSAVAGTIGMVIRLTQGHLPAGYGSYVPWGLWIAIYFHGVASQPARSRSPRGATCCGSLASATCALSA